MFGKLHFFLGKYLGGASLLTPCIDIFGIKEKQRQKEISFCISYLINRYQYPLRTSTLLHSDITLSHYYEGARLPGG